MRRSTGTKAAADLQIALDAFRRIVQALRMDRGSARRAPGVSSAQLFALQQLAEHPGASINDLAALTFTHQSSVSVVVQRLVEQRLVARTTAADDRRRQSLEVTAQGRRLLRRAPATPESLAMRGDLQAHLGDRAAAAASYQESERLEREGWASEQPQPGALARFLAERDRNIPEAVALAERAAAERQDIHTMDAMAWAYFKAGRLADADAAIGRAMRTGTVDPRIRCHATAIAEARRGGTPGRCDPLKPQA